MFINRTNYWISMKSYLLLTLLVLTVYSVEAQKFATGRILKSEIKPRNGNQPVAVPPVNPHEFTRFKAEIWPNPSTQAFNLKIDSPSDDVIRVYITDLSGKVISRFKTPNKETVNFGDNLARGLYFVKIIQGKEKKATLKIIRQ